MDWFTNIFTPDAITKGIDMTFLTEEERLIHQKDMLKLYAPFKLLQRYLSLMITAMFAFILLISTVLFLGSLKYEFLVGTAKAYTELEVVQMVGYSFMAVISLYMSGGVINSFKKDK